MFQKWGAIGATLPLLLAAFSSSSSYNLNSYGIGSGGTNNSSSSTYFLNAATGEIFGDTQTSGTLKNNPGSIDTRQASVPLAPTLSNGSGTFTNKLGCIINMSQNITDYTYAIAVSTDNFTTTNFVQASGALGASPLYQTYTAWGGASGTTITGLLPNTNYQVRVAAIQGRYTASPFGPTATMATVNPSVTFSISPNTISLGSLPAGSVVTSNNITANFSTNASSGGAVYLAGANGGLKSTSVAFTITSASADLAASGSGFGAQVSTVGQTSGGPLARASPYNGSSNNVGLATATFRSLLTTSAPLTGGSGTIVLKAKSAATTPAAADYTETLTFVASGSF